jgi:cobalt-zinc-cadmium efflux system outer membrane protein
MPNNFLKYFRRIFTVISASFFIENTSAQASLTTDTLRISREEAENIFLKNNLLLMAEKLNISQAEALALQASLWPNPHFSLDQVNLWATQKQLAPFDASLPPVAGSIGKNTEFALQLEQLILTAGKRKKLMAAEKVNGEISREYFEDLLRHLKLEFRNNLTQLQYLERYKNVLLGQLLSVRTLTEAYKRQLELGNLGKAEYIRLKAAELELSKEISAQDIAFASVEKELKILMALPPGTSLRISSEGFIPEMEKLKNIELIRVLQLARQQRPDLKAAMLEESYASGRYDYERARRIPDLHLTGGYDRGGNFMLNFIGFGVAMDLPVFDRNQGNIKHARIEMDKSKIRTGEKTLRAEAEIAEAYQKLTLFKVFYEQIDPGYEDGLDVLLESYTKNLIHKNISLLEYLDLQNAYLSNKKIILDAQLELNKALENLQYTIGQELE